MATRILRMALCLASMAAYVSCHIAIYGTSPIFVEAGQTKTVTFTANNCTSEVINIKIGSSDSRVFDGDLHFANVTCGFNGSVTVRGVAIGLARMTLSSVDDDEFKATHEVAVTRPPATVLDSVFIYLTASLSGLGMICFGGTLDLNIVRERLKKPKSLLIGLGCQFTIMPTIAFALAWSVPVSMPAALGMFTSGCVPAGGASNAWTKLLGGDVDLSVVLTFIGSFASFATLPLWMYTVGRLIYEGSHITIPYLDMLQTLVMTVVPLSVGVLLSRFVPRSRAVTAKAIYPLSIIFLLNMFVFGMYVNFFIFDIIRREPNTWFAMLLPFGGLLTSGIAAAALRETRAAVIAIAAEACVQNISTAVLLLRLSLPPPWSDMALCVALLVGMFQFVPLAMATVCRVLYQLISRRHGGNRNEDKADLEPPRGAEGQEKDAEEAQQSLLLRGHAKTSSPCNKDVQSAEI